MTKRKKLIYGALIFIFCGFCFFILPRVVFLIKCLAAEKEIENNFANNKRGFIELAAILNNTSPIQFDIYSHDSININFKDTSIDYVDMFIDSNYTLNPETKLYFRVNPNGCLEVIGTDTIEVCNHNWQVNFFGNYRDHRIDNLLYYYGWTRENFEQIVEKVQGLNCYSFANGDKSFGLSYKVVSYYNDGGLHCFGHEDGYFDYLYTTRPDSFFWKESLEQLDGYFYSIKYWKL